MKCSIILVFLLLGMSLVLATEGSMVDDTLTIEIHSISGVPNFTRDNIIFIEFNVTFISEEDPFNNYDFIFRLYENKSLSYSEGNILYRVTTTDTAENIDFAEDWRICNREKEGFERGWQQCQNELTEYKGKNTTICKEDLDECSLNLKEKDLDLGAKDDKILNLEEEEKETKNSKYIWGVIGLLLGAGALYLYERRGGSPKEKAMGEFQKSQAR